MNIDFKILKRFAVAHQYGAERMVLHILDRPLHHIGIFRRQHRILSGMERETDPMLPRQRAAALKQRIEIGQKFTVERHRFRHGKEWQQIAADTHHAQGLRLGSQRFKQAGKIRQVQAGKAGDQRNLLIARQSEKTGTGGALEREMLFAVCIQIFTREA